jgi:integrase
MAWSELDLDGRTWTIPGARAKNGKPNIVHLNGLAIEVLGQVHRIVDQDLLFSGASDWVAARSPQNGNDRPGAPRDRPAHRRQAAEPHRRHDSRRRRHLRPIRVSRRAQGRAGGMGPLCRGVDSWSTTKCGSLRGSTLKYNFHCTARLTSQAPGPAPVWRTDNLAGAPRRRRT